MHILVIEDDPAVRAALDRALRIAGHDVTLAPDGEQGLKILHDKPVDAVVLDIMLPGIDGLEVCTRVRATGSDVPVLMLTARTAVADRVAGLDAGADDYLVKPFALDELLARLRALLRRTQQPTGEVLTFADVCMESDTRIVRRGDTDIALTRTEYALLELFLRNPRRVLTRDVIFDRVWGYDFGPTSNSLEVYIGYLRRKMGDPKLIQTVRGVGYALREA
ncbi:MAG TPA: response regulator transcription factor [Actinomycetota bacterium]|nr:response regulator transcription factor [Actinomycetota bacterium]